MKPKTETMGCLTPAETILDGVRKLEVLHQIEFLNVTRQDELTKCFLSRFCHLSNFWPTILNQILSADDTTCLDVHFSLIRLAGPSLEHASFLKGLLSADEVMAKGAEPQENALDILLEWSKQEERYASFLLPFSPHIARDIFVDWVRNILDPPSLLLETLAGRLDSALADRSETELCCALIECLSKTVYRDKARKALQEMILENRLETLPKLIELCGYFISEPTIRELVYPYLNATEKEVRESAVYALETLEQSDQQIREVLETMLLRDPAIEVALACFGALEDAEQDDNDAYDIGTVALEVLNDTTRLNRWAIELLREESDLHIVTLGDFLEELLESARVTYRISSRLLATGKLRKGDPVIPQLVVAECVAGIHPDIRELKIALEGDDSAIADAAFHCIEYLPNQQRLLLLKPIALDSEHRLHKEAQKSLRDARYRERFRNEAQLAEMTRRWTRLLVIPPYASGIASFCADNVARRKGWLSSLCFSALENSLHNPVVRKAVIQATCDEFRKSPDLCLSPLSHLYHNADFGPEEILNEVL